MNDGLTTADCGKLITILENCSKIEKAVLYGSRAKGNFAPASDIDLALFGNGITLEDVLQLMDRVEECDVSVPVDLQRFECITSEPMRRQIASHGKLFWQREEAREALSALVPDNFRC